MSNKSKNPLQNKAVVCILAILCCALWGSANPLVKVGYSLFHINSTNTADVLLFAGLRFIISGLLVICIMSLIEGRFIKPKKEAAGAIFTLSMFQTVLQYTFFYIGIANTTGVKASIITGSNVFLAILVSSLIFKEEKYTIQKFIGSLIGFAGVIIVNSTKGLNGSGFSLMGDGFVFIAAVSYAFSSACLKRFSAKHDTIMLSGWQFLLGGVILTAIGTISGGTVTYFSLKALGVLVYLSFASAAAYSLWSRLLAYNDVSSVAVFGFTNPVFGVVFSKLFLPGESSSLGANLVLALLLVCVGIYIINMNIKERKGMMFKHV